MPDDYSADTQTSGSVAVGGSASGDIETARDFDWFAVEFVAGRTYVIDVEGVDTSAGSLVDPVLRGVYDADGDAIAGTRDRNGGAGKNARLTFSAAETGTHYIEARGKRYETGTYTVRVTDDAPDLGDLTDLSGTSQQAGSLDGTSGAVAYWRFTLTGEKVVSLQLLEQDADADLVLEGADGTVLYSSRESGTTDETLTATLSAGMYYVRVEAREPGANAFELHYEVTASQPPPPTLIFTPEELEALALSSSDDDYSQAVGRAGSVTVGGSVTGEIETVDDRDWFAMSFVAGKTYRIKLEGSATGQGTLDDPYLRGIFKMDGGDQHGNLIPGTGDNDGGTGANSEVLYTATESTTYYVAAGANGSSTGTYKLSVSEMEDDYAGGTDTTGTVEVEGSVTGDVQFADDRDWFAVTLVAGTRYRIKLEGSPTGQGTLDDPYLRGVYDQNGDLIADTSNDDGGTGYNSEVIYLATESATHYIAAGGYGSSTGTYKLSVLSVAEIDDDYAGGTDTTGTVEVEGSVTGDVQFADDRDWFAVTLVAGTCYRIKLEGSPTGQGTLDDPYLRGVYDQNGDLIADTSNDDGGTGYNSEVIYLATESATHYIAAGGYVDDWEAMEGTYRLSVTVVDDDYAEDTGTTGTVTVGEAATGELEYDGDRDWFGVALEGGKTYRIDVKGDTAADYGGSLHNPSLAIYDTSGNAISFAADDNSGVELNARLATFKPETDGTYFIEVRDPGGTGTYTVAVSVVAADASDDFAQAVTGAGTATIGNSVTGSIETAGDRDWFAATFEAGKVYRIKLEGSPTGQGTLDDPYLRGIYKGDGGDQDGNLIPGTGNDDGGTGANSEVLYTATESTTYYVAAGANGSSTGTYKLSVSEMEDDYAGGTVTTGTVEVEGSATGDVQFADDRDWFAVTLVAGTRYRIKLEGSPTGQGTLDDPYLRGVYDQNGDLIRGTSNDDGGTGYNSEVFYVASESATHYIAAGGFASHYRGVSKGTYRLSVTVVDDDYAEDTGTTGTVTVGETATGELEYDGDRDWFGVALEAGKTYRIDVKGDTAADYGGSLHNPSLAIYDTSGNAISFAADDNSGVGLNARLAAFVPDTDGKHYIEINDPGGLGTYTLAVEEVTDSL